MGNCCSPSHKYQDVDTHRASGHAHQNGQNGPRSTDRKSPGVKKLPDFGLGEYFEPVKILGKGGEGEAWLFKDKTSNEPVAIKLMKRPIPKPALAVIKREITIQGEIGEGHVNIVHATEVLLTKSHVGLAMEYIAGGTMVSYITRCSTTRKERGGLCILEDEARYYFRQLMSAVAYCHKHQIAHRDLKLDNTLLDVHNPPWIKLCDFGFAKHWHGASANMDTMRIGTLEYMGPELISSRTGYDGKKVDIWAAGILLYVMLMGKFPYESGDEEDTTARMYEIWIQEVKTSWSDLPGNRDASRCFSPELVDLLDQMLEVKQDKRTDISGVLAHPWFNKPLPEPFATAITEIEAAQEETERRLASVPDYSAERDRALGSLLEKASGAKAGGSTDIVLRVSLKRGVHATVESVMSAVKEEE